jgi:hypothetical protein
MAGEEIRRLAHATYNILEFARFKASIDSYCLFVTAKGASITFRDSTNLSSRLEEQLGNRVRKSSSAADYPTASKLTFHLIVHQQTTRVNREKLQSVS